MAAMLRGGENRSGRDETRSVNQIREAEDGGQPMIPVRVERRAARSMQTPPERGIWRQIGLILTEP